MAHFRGTVNSGRSDASRLGHKSITIKSFQNLKKKSKTCVFFFQPFHTFFKIFRKNETSKVMQGKPGSKARSHFLEFLID